MIYYSHSDGKSYGHIDGGLSSSNTLTPISGTFTGLYDVALGLKAGLLSGGTYYKFKLTVTDIAGTVASNIFELKTNGIPAKGKYYIHVRCYGCVVLLHYIKFNCLWHRNWNK